MTLGRAGPTLRSVGGAGGIGRRGAAGGRACWISLSLGGGRTGCRACPGAGRASAGGFAARAGAGRRAGIAGPGPMPRAAGPGDWGGTRATSGGRVRGAGGGGGLGFSALPRSAAGAGGGGWEAGAGAPANGGGGSVADGLAAGAVISGAGAALGRSGGLLRGRRLGALELGAAGAVGRAGGAGAGRGGGTDGRTGRGIAGAEAVRPGILGGLAGAASDGLRPGMGGRRGDIGGRKRPPPPALRIDGRAGVARGRGCRGTGRLIAERGRLGRGSSSSTTGCRSLLFFSRIFSRTLSAVASSSELECDFGLSMSKSGSTARISLDLTSNSRASSLMRIVLLLGPCHQGRARLRRGTGRTGPRRFGGSCRYGSSFVLSS